MVDWPSELARYRGEWFFHNFVDPCGAEDRSFVRTLLDKAKAYGFKAQVKDEAGEEFEGLKA
jgi:hypothetical protein